MTRLRLRRRLWKGVAGLAIRQQCGKRRGVWHGGFPRYDPPAMYWYTDRHGWGCLRLGHDIVSVPGLGGYARFASIRGESHRGACACAALDAQAPQTDGAQRWRLRRLRTGLCCEGAPFL